MYIAYYDREKGSMESTEYTSEKYSYKELNDKVVELNKIEQKPKYWLIIEE